MKPAYASEVLSRPPSALRQNDFLLLLDGGLVFAAGEIFNVEKSVNPVVGWAVYEDGTVKETEMTHSISRVGGYLEYLLDDRFGLQLGFLHYVYFQEVSVGGGQYEKKTFAQGNLLTYGLPFAGGAFYLVNAPEVTLSLIGRLGLVAGGTFQPMVTAFDYFGGEPDRLALTGFSYGAGLGLQYIAYRHLVLGAAVMVNQHQLHSSKKVDLYSYAGRDLSQDFSLTAVDLNLSLGVRF